MHSPVLLDADATNRKTQLLTFSILPNLWRNADDVCSACMVALNFKAQLPQYAAIVRVHPDVFPRLRFSGRFARIGQAEPPDADGWIRVSLRFDVEEMAVEWALSFGSNIEVLEPSTLREKVIAAAEGVLAFYAER